MRNRYWFRGLRALAVLAFALICVSESHGQALNRKHLPTLSLVKMFATRANDVTARDTQYVSEAGPGERRYFLLPIYVKNCLDSLTDTVSGFQGEPIYSFRFKLQYNNTLLRAVGVQKRGPLPFDTNVLAKTFNLSWDVDQDLTYKVSTVGGPSANGERIMVTGSSSLPLPLSPPTIPNATACQFRDTTVLCYVLFEVLGQANSGSTAIRDQMILTRDSIMWNNYGVNVTPEMFARGFDQFQEGVAPTPVFPITYPNDYGSSVIQITSRPRIDLFPTSQVQQVNNDPSNYELLRPLQTQYGNNNYIFRNILLVNGAAGTYLRNVVIESDQPWLRVDTNDPNLPPGVQPGGTRPDDRGLYVREVGAQLNFNVVANPEMLPQSDGTGYPTPGVYVGYITIRSVDAVNSAVRLRVVLIVNRNPLEDQLTDTSESTNTRGIQLLFRNSTGDTTYLTFGTGIGATDNVDTLFGEREADSARPAGQFFARFYPPSVVAANPAFPGLLDTRGLTRPTNGESSIDIRNFRVNTTQVYCVNFSAGGPQRYPVVIEYDINDFPDGAQLFIRDNVNGLGFSSDLRRTTPLGGTRYAFFIRDPNITGFCIEYTLPSVTQFPEIKEGWNFVSLPVRPSDNRSAVIFPNGSSGKPARYTQSQYVFDDTVAVGYGYFIKYGQILDKVIAGTPFRQIHELNTPFVVKIFEGWNTVGGLSVPTSTDYMTFGPIPGQGSPVRTAEVYRYITDRGYEQVSLIIPGYGYWIKIDRPGYYRLVAPPNTPAGKFAPAIDESYKSLNRLSIADNGQKVGTLYFGHSSSINASRFELPPAMNGMFDVRFGNNGMVSASASSDASHLVNFQGVDYPVVLSVPTADANYVVTNAATGEVLGTFTRGQAGAVRVTDQSVKAVKLTSVASTSMELGSAFPNPVSGKASFDFNVPSEQFVKIALFNGLGAEVKVLFNGRVAGQQSVEFSTEGLPSGVYYYKMTTESGKSLVRQIVVSK